MTYLDKIYAHILLFNAITNARHCSLIFEYRGNYYFVYASDCGSVCVRMCVTLINDHMYCAVFITRIG